MSLYAKFLGLHSSLLLTCGAVYIMDHEVVPRPYKTCDWLLNLSWDHFGLHWGKIVRVIMEFEVSKRHILRTTLSNDMVQWVLWWARQKRRYGLKRQGPMAEKYFYNKILMKYFLRKRRWRQEKTKEWSKLIFFLSKISFLGIYQKKSAHSFFGAWSFFLIHIWFTPSRNPHTL